MIGRNFHTAVDIHARVSVPALYMTIELIHETVYVKYRAR